MSKRTSFHLYYPIDPEEEAYLRFLEAPGEGLGQMLGDAPTIEAVLSRRAGRIDSIAASRAQKPRRRR